MAIYSSTKEYIGNLNGAAEPILRSLSPIGRMSRNKLDHHLRSVSGGKQLIRSSGPLRPEGTR